LIRFLFKRINGLIRSIEAPVVPMKFAATDPMMSKMVFAIGVPSLSILIRMPPDAINKDASNEINWIYSIAACIGLCELSRMKM